MRKMSAVSTLLFLAVGMLGCNAARQAGSTPATGTNITAGAWVVTINNFIGGQTDTVTAVNPYPNGTLVYDGAGPSIGFTSCDNDGLTYTVPGQAQTGGTPVVGPACFVNLGYGCSDGCGSTPQSIASTNTNDAAGDLIIGVPVNPASNGSTFNISYNELSDKTVWQMDGTGTISNGIASGTWICDPSTPACSGITGTFTATQQ